VSASRRYVGALADDRRFRELVVSRPWPLRGREAELALIRELPLPRSAARARSRWSRSAPVSAPWPTTSTRSFPKLGIATRAALRDALSALTPEQQRAGGDG
jgi:hypothetical protein